ncbi:MAG: GatB/YqeY domain-containing protein [bacterium]
MKLMERLTEEMKKAMKSQDKERLSALRMLISAVRYALIDSPEMGEEKVVEVLRREAKKRRESVEAYRQGGREEQAQKEEKELEVIGEFLPPELSEAEIREKVRAALEGSDPSNFGMAMSTVMKALGGQGDGAMVARMVREEFAQKQK